MLGDGPGLTGGAQKIILYTNEYYVKNLLSYDVPALMIPTLNIHNMSTRKRNNLKFLGKITKFNFCGQIFRIVQISVLFSSTFHFSSAMPTRCEVFRYYSSSIAILKIYALRVTLQILDFDVKISGFVFFLFV